MPKTFFFYDLETSGLDARDDRVMQFAGIRTTEAFESVGEPVNVLVRLDDDTLPSPGALMVTGITPQQTVSEGYTEAQFAKLFIEEVCTPDTTILGFNTIRFDDEFMRALLWRNFYDPYEWAYKDGRSRWDMLDVVRMTRALRPDGISWPVVDGKPTNKLELLARENGVVHTRAHDALSDVEALIAITKMIADKQPKLFQYLLALRSKDAVKKLVSLEDTRPFVYASGRYSAEFEKTTVALPIAEAEHGNVYVYDLRIDPTPWLEKSSEELTTIYFTPYKDRDESYQSLPVKKLQYNRCPAVAPLGVLEQDGGWHRLGLDLAVVEKHRTLLLARPDWVQRVAEIMNRARDYPAAHDAEGKLYDGFLSPRDTLRVEAVRNATPEEMLALDPKFDDPRLQELFIHYKARNYPQSLGDDERAAYEAYRTERLKRQAQKFMREINGIIKQGEVSDDQQFILEELRLWFESVYPYQEADEA